MTAKQINIDPKEKTINIFVDDVTVDEIKEILKHFVGLDDYEVFVHNPNQSTSLIHVYEGDIHIDNVFPKRNFYGSENYYAGGVIREFPKDPNLIL